MTDDEMRIAIAEAMGLDSHDVCSPLWGGQGANPYYVNFLNDLNACHEMEMWLKNRTNATNDGLYYEFCERLEEALGHWEHVSATARQRCIAFLKTIGKWVE